MELLTVILRNKYHLKLIDFHPKCRNLCTTSLCYADDLLIFTKPNTLSFHNIACSLEDFFHVSGLQTNHAKSSMMCSGLAVHNLSSLSAVFNLHVQATGNHYLGLPLATTRTTKLHCTPMYERITKRLNSWCNKQLSAAGRLTIVKSVAFSMQVYYSRVFILPKILLRVIEQACNHFIWSGNPFSRKPIPISLSKIHKSLKHGGLGVLNLIRWNVAATSVHLNNLINSSNSIWKRWCMLHYIGSTDFWTVTIKQNASWIWRNVLKLRDKLKHLYILSISETSSASFWHSPWAIYGLSLYDCLPYANILHSGIPLRAKATSYIQNGDIVLPYCCSFAVRHVWSSFASTKINYSSSDELLWGDKKKQHSIRYVYHLLSSSGSVDPWHNSVWDSSGNPKQNLFMWRVLHNAILTQDRLCHTGMLTSSFCTLCGQGNENNAHLFFECAFSFAIWSKILSISSMHSPRSTSDDEWYCIYLGTRWRDFKSTLLLLSLKTCLIEIWKEGNMRRFENISRMKVSRLFA